MCYDMETNKWLWQPNKNGPIHLRVGYKDKTGKSKTFTKSLRTKNWKTARKIRDTEFAPIILDMEKARAQHELIHKIYPQLEVRLETGVNGGYIDDSPVDAPTLQETYDAWAKALNTKNGNYYVAPKTTSRYSGIVRSFILFHGGGKMISGLDKQSVIEFRDKRMTEDGVTKKTMMVELNAIRNFFSYAMEKHGLPLNPAAGIVVRTTKADKNRAGQSRSRRPPSHEEADKICTAFPVGKTKKYTRDDCQDFAMIARYTGLRQGEIAQLRKDNFKLCDKDQYVDVALKNPQQHLATYTGSTPKNSVLCIYLHDDDQMTTKTGEVRLVPVADKLLVTVKKRIKSATNNGSLFPFAFDDTGAVFGRFWLKRVKKIDEELTMHGFRHYTTSEMGNNNVNDAISHMVVGHNPGKVHDDYFHKTVQALKEAVDKIH